MARSQFWDTAIDAAGNAITTTRVTVYNMGTSTLSTVYANESGGTLKGNPFNATTGFIDFWMEPGSYDVVIADTAIPAAYTTRTVRWESIPGIDGVITQTVLDDAITSGKIDEEQIQWEHIEPGYPSIGMGPGYLSRRTPLNTTTYSRDVGNNNNIVFANAGNDLTFSTPPYSTDYVDSGYYDASTGIYTCQRTGLYMLSMEFNFNIVNGGVIPNINIQHNTRVGNYSYTMIDGASVGNGSNKLFNITRMIEMRVNTTMRIYSGIGAGASVQFGHVGSYYYSSLLIVPMFPLEVT